MPRDVLQTLSKLPAESFDVLPSDPRRLIGIHRGVPGYTPLRSYATDTEARAEADRLNAERGVTPAQAEAMKAGSIFGWHVPAADPDTYTAAKEDVCAPE